MGSEDVRPHAREKIERLAEAALREAEVVDVFPTPLDAVQRAVGIAQRLEMSDLPSAVAVKKPPVMGRILGALLPHEKTVFVDVTQRSSRVLFTDAHEASHAMCGWHTPTLMLDSESELFKREIGGIEAEANFGAAALIFQNGRFHRRALENQVSLGVPLRLASDYGASIHATMWHYADRHPDRVALLISGRFANSEGKLPIFNSVQSATFTERYGSLASRTAPDGLATIDGPAAPYAEILDGVMNGASGVVGAELVLLDRADRSRRCYAEAFFNQRSYFVMVSERQARRLGRRSAAVRAAA